MDPEETVSLDKSASSGIIIAYNTTVDEKNETEKSDKGVVNMAFTLGDEKGKPSVKILKFGHPKKLL